MGQGEELGENRSKFESTVFEDNRRSGIWTIDFDGDKGKQGLVNLASGKLGDRHKGVGFRTFRSYITVIQSGVGYKLRGKGVGFGFMRAGDGATKVLERRKR